VPHGRDLAEARGRIRGKLKGRTRGLRVGPVHRKIGCADVKRSIVRQGAAADGGGIAGFKRAGGDRRPAGIRIGAAQCPGAGACLAQGDRARPVADNAADLASARVRPAKREGLRAARDTRGDAAAETHVAAA